MGDPRLIISALGRNGGSPPGSFIQLILNRVSYVIGKRLIAISRCIHGNALMQRSYLRVLLEGDVLTTCRIARVLRLFDAG